MRGQGRSLRNDHMCGRTEEEPAERLRRNNGRRKAEERGILEITWRQVSRRKWPSSEEVWAEDREPTGSSLALLAPDRHPTLRMAALKCTSESTHSWLVFFASYPETRALEYRLLLASPTSVPQPGTSFILCHFSPKCSCRCTWVSRPWSLQQQILCLNVLYSFCACSITRNILGNFDRWEKMPDGETN